MALSHQIYITDPRVEGPRPSPQQFIELHLAAWKQEATEKSLWTGESGLPNEKNRKRERETKSAAASGGNLPCYSPEAGASPTQEMGGSRPDNQ